MKDQKGITLIALVITIIVLLILAGVAIAMLSGDNGILNKASESAEYNAIGEVKDDISLTVSEAVTYYLDHTYNNAALPSETVAYKDATSVEDVIEKVLDGYKSSNSDVTYKYDKGSTGKVGTVTLTSKKYQVTGKPDETTGAFKWESIGKKPAGA